MLDVCNTPIRIERGDQLLKAKALFSEDLITMPVDADIEEGDVIVRTLPNGKDQRVVVTQVTVLQSPFGSNRLDHTEIRFDQENKQGKTAQPVSLTFNARQIQYTGGDSINQRMTIGMSSEEVSAVISGLLQVIAQNASVREDELSSLEKGLANDDPGAVKKALSWLLGKADGIADTGVKAAVTFSVNALLKSLGLQ